MDAGGRATQEQLPRAQGCEHLILLGNLQVILATCFGIAIHGFWIPAIPAGMTCFKILAYKYESSSLKTSVNNPFNLC